MNTQHNDYSAKLAKFLKEQEAVTPKPKTFFGDWAWNIEMTNKFNSIYYSNNQQLL